MNSVQLSSAPSSLTSRFSRLNLYERRKRHKERNVVALDENFINEPKQILNYRHKPIGLNGEVGFNVSKSNANLSSRRSSTHTSLSTIPHPVSSHAKVSFSRHIATIKTYLDNEPPSLLKSLPKRQSRCVAINFQSFRSFYALLSDVEQRFVSLENLHFEYPIVSGSILVKNVAFEKSIQVHFTTDYWKTQHILQAKYDISLTGRNVDRFLFDINVGSIFVDGAAGKPAVAVQLALRYEVENCVYWDNNHKKNYGLSLVYAADPALSERLIIDEDTADEDSDMSLSDDS